MVPHFPIEFRQSLILHTLYAFLLCFFALTTLPVLAQLPLKQIKPEETSPLNDNALSKILANAHCPTDIQSSFLWGIFAYPELYGERITIKYKKIRSAGAARPSLGSLFRNKSNRRYNIFVNTDTNLLGNAVFAQLPYNAKIGLLSHELAHILVYSKKSSLALIGNGFLYILSKRYRGNYEDNTDDIVINRGFGWQIYDFTNFVMYRSTASEKYKKFKVRHYKSPNEMLFQITNHPLYKNN